MSQPLIEFRQVGRVYGDLWANQDLDLVFHEGEIHGLIGENGAGKSTAMKLLFGLEEPDQGEILFRGKKKTWKDPQGAMAEGLGMVHQHFMLAGPLTALENLILAEGGSGLDLVDHDAARTKYTEMAHRFGFQIDFDRPVEELPVGVQQRLEILKVLSKNAKVLILDEPTAVLTPPEVHELFQQLRELKNQGRTLILISHKLKEILSLTDRISVLRKGRRVATKKTSETQAEELAELMIGHREKPWSQPTKRTRGDCVLRLKNFSLPKGPGRSLKDLSFELHAGEILGIAGVEGNGQDRLIKALAEGQRQLKMSQGQIELLGHDLCSASAQEIRSWGCAFFPENRHRDGMIGDWPAWQNFLLGQQRLPFFRQGFFLRDQLIQASAREAFTRFDLQPLNLDLPLSRFSGGNQQKAVVARELSRPPRFLLAAHPTRGVDIGALRLIHEKILEARDQGAAVLLMSSEIDELFRLADRLLVMFDGRFVREMRRDEYNEMELGLAMGGGR